MSRTATGATYPTINTVGALLPPDLLTRLANGELDHLAPGTYGLPETFTLRQAAARAWELLLPTYRSLETRLDALPEGDPATTITRDRWTTVLLRELGYDLEPIPNITIEDDTFDVVHIDGHVPVHMLGWNVDLDKRAATNIRGASRTAPHSLIQELLNRSEAHLWAILTNGKRLRLLRDNIVMGRPAYIEFDLEGMFTGEQFADFAILYALAHATRLRSDEPADCILEQWRTTAINDGTRALEHLRDGVVEALRTLGTGFLEHPDNRELRDLIAANHGATDDYYRWLLRLVYRLIFLFVAEDRDLLHADGVPTNVRLRYADHFSTARLRADADKRRAGRHGDKWQSLLMVFNALGVNGEESLGLPAYGSILFNPDSLEALNRAKISNQNLLRAISYLSQLPDTATGTLRPVDYKNLGSEELGSVYEALLEYVPNVQDDHTTFTLTVKAGNARKTTGSYYTPTELVEVVLDQSLNPLLDEAVGEPDPEAAILAITVCDPACGSGHFLVAAARRIARRLAMVRSGDPEPTVENLRDAMREVVAHCIYGVDLNDLAAELAKISLWLEALTPGRPLAFLDAHIKVGNGLIGATPALLADNIPDVAFTAIKGDDKAFASTVKKHNKRERERIAPDQGELWEGQDLHEVFITNRDFGRALAEVEATGAATDIETLRKQADAWRRAEADPGLQRARLVADAWCAAFVWPLNNSEPGYTEPITHRTLLTLQNSPDLVPLRQRRDALGALARRYRFFHWHLEFPQIFEVPTRAGAAETPQGWNGGFSLMLGNPPWDTLSPDRREFFGQFVEGIRGLPKAEQDQQIDELMQEPAMATAWETYERDLLATVHFLKNSGRYTLYAPGNLGKGDFNVYRNFVEHALRTVRPGGYAAQVVPGGLYGGANASAIRRHMVTNMHWQVLLGCINTGGKWFKEVDIDRFCAYATRNAAPGDDLKVAFGLDSPQSVRQDIESRRIAVPTASIGNNNPETFAVPDVRDPVHAQILFQMVSQTPAFGAEIDGVVLREYQREIDMGTDTHLFVDHHSTGLPVYEGRMVDHFDYRAKKYLSGHGNNSKWLETPFGDPQKGIHPQWRVPRQEVPSKVGSRVDRYRIGFADVANPRNARSLTATLIAPGNICGHTVPTFTFEEGQEWAYMPFLAAANALCVDFLARQRLTSIHMSYTVLDSLPIPRLSAEHPLVRPLLRRAAALACAGPEMRDYWEMLSAEGWVTDLGPTAIPGETSTERRTQLRTELDVLVARDMYAITKDQMASILDTFPTLERRDIREFGTFVTRDRILDNYNSVQP
ncbi:N-6 DNA methylase [Nocardioides caricicola]|uniref:site-specific DNA-methyltransferase (adenine-specific) n=1 Tax=Nocardioides caricicola TaxID=634770 RepID=A0ABW0MWI4_9ACTN